MGAGVNYLTENCCTGRAQQFKQDLGHLRSCSEEHNAAATFIDAPLSFSSRLSARN